MAIQNWQESCYRPRKGGRKPIPDEYKCANVVRVRFTPLAYAKLADYALKHGVSMAYVARCKTLEALTKDMED